MLKRLVILCFATILSFQSFAATMNSRVRQVPKDIQEQVFVSPKETLPELVKFLAGTSGDTASRVKILHDWICDNIAYDCDVFTEKGAGQQDYETVLKKKKAVCIGYANLMAAMCFYAKIEVDIISGWSKGFNYPGYLREQSDHAWNAVKINGKWNLIDVTWDAGYVERTTFIKHYTLQWYNLTPSQFIYSHLPDEDKWQLLPEKQVRSHKQFEKEPYIPGIFFEYGLSFGKNVPGYTNEISEATAFDFVSPNSNVNLMPEIYGINNSFDMSNAMWIENSGTNKRFIFDVPDKDLYKVRIGARTNGVTNNPDFFLRTDFEQNIMPKTKNLLAEKKITKNEAELFEKSYFLIEENNRYYFAEDLFDNARNSANKKILKLLERNTSRYENVLSFEVKASESYSGFGKTTARFPQMYRGYASATNIKLESPLKGVLKKGAEEHFSIKTSAYSKIVIVLGEGDFVFVPKDPKTGAFELDYKVPENVSELNFYASKDGKQFATIFSYKVE